MAILALSGCGESSAEKNAKARSTEQQAIHQLNKSTRSAAQAGIELKQAQARHRAAVERLRELEGKP